MSSIRFPLEALSSVVQAALEKEGVPPAIASVEAQLAIDADLQGVPSHGLSRLPLLLRGLRDGRTKAVPEIRLLRSKAAISVLDGDHGPGRYVSTRAMSQAMEHARTLGIGACLAVRTSHWGRGHAYAVQAAREGLIGIAMTNAVTSMAGWGATGRVVGNNPLAIAVPGIQPDEPVVLDMAMSQAAVGKVATWLREGKAIPSGWGVDAQGRPSDDAAAILQGAVLPMGGHKGAGLALMIQLMTAALGAGLFDHELRDHDPSGLDSESTKLFVALDVEAFTELGEFRKRTAELKAWLAAHAASDAEPFLFPGERGWNQRAQNLAEGVPLHRDLVDQLKAAGVLLEKEIL